MTSSTLDTKLAVVESFASEYLCYYRMLPLELTGERLLVAVAGEPNEEALEDLGRTYARPVSLVPVSEEDLFGAIRRAFSASESVVELIRDLGAAGEAAPLAADDSLADIRDLANQPPVIRFVNLLIREAHEAAASDIHLEATRDGLRVRLRLDGVLSEMPSPPAMLQSAVVSRIKLLAQLDIAERRAPQDGRIRVRLERRELDLRVSTIPTLYGESVVLRLLDRGGRPVQLDDLGMASDCFGRFSQLASKAHGIILATGPTGSGKTTTLYASLALRNAAREKIITVEDPVEYHLKGITQVPVQSKVGMTFGSALRSILRQDPDILMIGEMRDAETAGIAVQAAMTGHLVFSTLHTNDAVGALTRLTDLQVEPYMIAATVEGILAQRLVRRICPDCREQYRPDPSMLEFLASGPVLTSSQRLFRGKGCGTCRQTGYKGRTGIFELLTVTDEIRKALTDGPDPQELRALAQETGMVTLKQDGWRKIQAGLTTIDEVLRVVE